MHYIVIVWQIKSQIALPWEVWIIWHASALSQLFEHRILLYNFQWNAPEVLCCGLPCATNDFAHTAHSLHSSRLLQDFWELEAYVLNWTSLRSLHTYCTCCTCSPDSPKDFWSLVQTECKHLKNSRAFASPKMQIWKHIRITSSPHFIWMRRVLDNVVSALLSSYSRNSSNTFHLGDSSRFLQVGRVDRVRPGKREVLLAVCRPILARIAHHTGTQFRGTMTLPAFLEVYLQIKVAPPNLRNHIKIIVRVGLSKWYAWTRITSHQEWCKKSLNWLHGLHGCVHMRRQKASSLKRKYLWIIP